MKLKLLNKAIVLIWCLLVAYSCNHKIDIPVPDLKLEESSVTLNESENVTVKIISGNGNYKTSTSPEGIVSASVTDDKSISITGLQKGNTTVTVTDEKGKSATIKAEVTGTIKVDKNTVELTAGKDTSVQILSGNDNYTLSVSPPDIIEASVKDKEISIKGLKVGTATITVTDAKNTSTTLTVTVKESPMDARDADGKFSLAIYPDTQTEVQSYGTYVKQQFIDRSSWVVTQRDALDIRGVLHVGDVVNWDDAPVRDPWTTDDHFQYLGAVKGLKPLRDAKIPTSLSIGNHDNMATGGGNGGSARDTRYTYQYLRMTESFNYYLDHAEDIPTWKAFEQGKVDNGYWIFEAAGAKWLVLNLELWPRTAVTNWAKGIIDANPDRNVIIQTHNMFNGSCGIAGGEDKERYSYGDNSPLRVWNELVEPYPNVKVVTSGHEGVQCAKVFTTKKGNKVIGTLQNNVNDDYKNPVRILEIDVRNGKATTWNYSTVGNQTRDKVELTGLNFIKN
ncbi:MAG: pilus assembly protein N-terminal domain-containing protein [Niabella sp.]